MGLFKKRRVALTRDQALACVPVRNDNLSWSQLDSGLVRIDYALPLSPLLLGLFRRFAGPNRARPTRTLELDEIGSQVWLMLDGSRTTADIIRLFARQHTISTQESERAVTLFLRELGKRGLMGLR